MVTDTLKQIENINASLQWIKQYRPEHYESRFLQLVEERRKLKKLANAEYCNPGIAAFGQSQVGKSYLMNCILQNPDTPFMVDAPDRQYNFVDEINPIGEGAEATGVVTRFTSYLNNETDYSSQYPIRMRVMGLKDVILTICDTYFLDFEDYTTLGEVELIETCEALKGKYTNAPLVSNPILSADDLLDMKFYFRKQINNGQVYSTKTPFFDTIAYLIDRIPVTEYASIFSILWNRETEYTKLFDKAFSTLKKLNFETYVYLPMGAVFHNGVKHDTIMSVSCLNLLLTDSETQCLTNAYSIVDGNTKDLGKFSKSELCLVCFEVIIKIGKDFITTVGEFDINQIEEENLKKLPNNKIELDILKTTDLLDFPGARARGGFTQQKIKEHKNLMLSLLRGKVAYLFNNYNEEKLINILLLCHHHKNVEAPQMGQLLDSWVNEYVGDTPEKRARYIETTEISPLFHIGTMFNLNLRVPDNGILGKTKEAIISRWNGRFSEKLLTECFRKTSENWVSNWTEIGKPFQNCYMLRDYKFSNDVYDGWERTGKEESLVIEQDYYDLMRELFIECNKEYKIFEDSSLAWDVSATRNNDGALYILQQLSKVSANIALGRSEKIAEQRNVCRKNILAIMKDYFVSNDMDEILQTNISKANGIFRELEFTCQSEPEFFGHLIQALQMTEAESFKELHKLLPTLTSTVYDSNSIKDYELIRKRCNNFAGLTSEDAKWKSFMAQYHFSTQEEAAEFLRRRNIDVQKLFQGDTIKRKNSAVISNHLMTLWEKKINSMQMTNMFTGAEHMDEIVMSDLVSCIINTSVNINLMNHIESDIADYVDVLNISTINEDLIADMIATTISDFITNFGYDYLTPEQIANSQRVAREYNLPCFNWIEKERKEEYDEDEMTELFNDILSSSNHYTPAYEANYNSWLEYLYIAYISHLNIPDYNKEENDKLKMILDALK